MKAVLVLAAVLQARLALAGEDPATAQDEAAFRAAAENGVRSEEVFRRTRKMLHAWLAYADERTLLLPDYLPGVKRATAPMDLYTPHNSGADNYPYLVATAFFTDRALYDGRMREMLRNEIRYTNVKDGVPGNLELETQKLGPLSLFGAAEYAKDGLLAITELLGRTPWFFRMADMTAGLMQNAPVPSRFGLLPDSGAELNGDVLQTLVRLATMTGDRRFLEWAERIGDAYIEEVLPANHDLPGYTWDFTKHEGPDRMRLRDHGNEIVVGLTLLHALESDWGRPRAATYRPADRRRCSTASSPRRTRTACSTTRSAPPTSSPSNRHLSDNWGYVYGSVYTHYMVTGEKRYRDAVLRVLQNLPRYRGHDWENGSQDGYADSIESALYLVAREPVPEAISTGSRARRGRCIAFQQADGTIERWYGDGNWNRTLLLYAMWKTQGCYVDGWREGVEARRHSRGRSPLRVDRRPGRLEGQAPLRLRSPPPDLELRAELRASQRVARVVHGRREHALPGGGRRRDARSLRSVRT